MPTDSRKSAVLLGQAVRDLREREEISQLKLAERADLSLTFVSQIENGKTSVSLATLLKLSRAFGLTGADLMRRAGL